MFLLQLLIVHNQNIFSVIRRLVGSFFLCSRYEYSDTDSKTDFVTDSDVYF